jgi:hypothetical protein
VGAVQIIARGKKKVIVEEIDDVKEPRVLGYIFLGNRACQVNTPSPWNQSHAFIIKDNGAPNLLP